MTNPTINSPLYP